MYAAKRCGGNCYQRFIPSLNLDAELRMSIASDLRKAIKNDELMVYYQPIVDITTGEVNKAEALLRWKHPEKGMISPMSFIPVAEETGLIIEIGNWVFLQVSAFAKYLRNSYNPDFKISFNKSPVQFRNNGNFKKDILATMLQSDIQSMGIVIEITEGLLLDENIDIQQKLQKLKNSGFQLALDDFGTGYSSLSYLHKFDIDYIKIDKSFVQGLELDVTKKELCEIIIVLAHKLSIEVIAEGVETTAQMDFLLNARCDYGQGFLWSKALPIDQFESFLNTSPRGSAKFKK